MPCLKLRDPSLPPSLAGGFDRPPRPATFRPTIWVEMAHARASGRTQQVHLGALDRLYASAEGRLWGRSVGRAVPGGEQFLDVLEQVLAGFLGKLRNDGLISGTVAPAPGERRSGSLATSCGCSSAAEVSDMKSRLRRLERLYGQLSPTPPSTRAPLRALPALVIEDLWRQFDPTSGRNPFRSTPLQWRNLLIFLLLLHLGLRRGEVGLLPANAIKNEFDPAAGEERYWINVEPSADFDPRYEAPGLKAETARRQLPISHEILKVHDVYVQNYRAKGSHPFLITSQQARPLSLRAFGYVFETRDSEPDKPCPACARKSSPGQRVGT